MKNKQFTIGAVFSYGAIAFNIISGLLFTPWMIRTLGNDQYALYTLAVSVINIFLLDFGMGSAVTKFLSNYYARSQHEEADRFMGIVYKVYMVISALIAIGLAIFYFLIDTIYVKLTPTELRVFKHLFLIVAAYSVLSFPFTTFNGILSANERFIELKASDFLHKVFNVGLILLFLLLGKGVYTLVLVHAFTNFAFLLLKYVFIRKHTKQRAKLSTWDAPIAKSLFGYSIWTTIISLAQRCMFNIMPSIIAAVIGSAEVTLFSLASTLEGYVYIFANAINGMLMPKISRVLETENAGEKLTQLMTKIGKYQICTIGLLYVGFLCLGRDFVGLWMGDGYEAVYWGALALIFPSLITMPQQVAAKALLVKDVVKEQGLIYVGMAVINIVLSILFLSTFGILGASLSICIAFLFTLFCKNILLYRRKLPVKLSVFFAQTYGKWFVVAIGSVLLYVVLLRHIPLAGWMGFLLKACLLAVFYLGMYAVFCLDKEMRQNILNKIKRKRT